MSDLQKYIKKKKLESKEFSLEYDTLAEEYALRDLLRQLRKEAGLTQKELAVILETKETAISRIENHALDIRLATLEKYAKACGRNLKLLFA